MDPKTQTDGLLVGSGLQVSICWHKWNSNILRSNFLASLKRTGMCGCRESSGLGGKTGQRTSSRSFRRDMVTLACPSPRGAATAATLAHVLQPTSELTCSCGGPVHADSPPGASARISLLLCLKTPALADIRTARKCQGFNAPPPKEILNSYRSQWIKTHSPSCPSVVQF